MKTTEKLSTTEKLIKFVNQRAGLEFANYGDVKAYRKESAEITRDRADFYELLSLAQRRYEGKFNEALTQELTATSGRLTLQPDGELQYTTGQYFCTEYRLAANQILTTLIWKSYREEKDEQGQPVYKDGNEMRKAIKRNFSRRINRNYFN